MGTQLSSRLAVKDSEAGVEGAIDSFDDHRNVMTTRSAFLSATGNEIVRSIFGHKRNQIFQIPLSRGVSQRCNNHREAAKQHYLWGGTLR